MNWFLALLAAALIVAMAMAGCTPPPPSVDELNAVEQKRLAKEAAQAR